MSDTYHHHFADLKRKLLPSLPTRPHGATSGNAPPQINYSTKPTTQHTVPYAADNTSRSSDNIFERPVISAGYSFDTRPHLVEPKSSKPCSSTGVPIQTNKFYSNLYLGSQKQQIYPLPYVLKWSGSGLDIHHSDTDQQVYGPDPRGSTAQYVFCPVGIVSLSLSASQALSSLDLSDPEQFSIGLTLTPVDHAGKIEVKVVRGSAFISAQYCNLTPEVHSGVMIRQIEFSRLQNSSKWRLTLEDGKKWLLYATSQSHGPPELEMVHNGLLRAKSSWTGCLQIAKLPEGDPAVEGLFDAVAGSFPLSMTLTGKVDGDRCQYQFDIQTCGSQAALMYCLPHHRQSFDSVTSSKVFPNAIASQTNGSMSLIWSNQWIMQEQLPPSANLQSCPKIESSVQNTILKEIDQEAIQDFDRQINLDSMYFSGKAMNKLAQLALIAKRLGSTSAIALQTTLERNLQVFVSNRQQFGLCRENTWGGIVSTQGFTDRGDGADFGNTWYNDHHYHFGYFISSAAILLELNPNTTIRGDLTAWASMLIRDVASPMRDAEFPAFRSMDWFVGHSWSKGIYESADGKDEESSSEDYHFTYATYLFAKVTQDEALLQRCLIQLSVQRSSMQMYMLFSPKNSCMPHRLLSNCVSGIKFENKIDYTTYFSPKLECIHGIHMLPITPITSFMRHADFVQHEWDTKLSNLIARSKDIEAGWRGILYANIGLLQGIGGPAWQYFLDGKNATDGGVCRSWYLAMLAAVRP